MDKFFRGIIAHKKAVVAVFLMAAVVCACLIPFVKTNYNMVDYLPEEAQSTTAVAIMSEEFTSSVPNTNVLVHDVTIAHALTLKQEISEIDGVESVLWLDDVVDVAVPLEVADKDTVEAYYRVNEDTTTGVTSAVASTTDGSTTGTSTTSTSTTGTSTSASATSSTGTALFQVSIADGKEGVAIPALRDLVDRESADNAAAGGAGEANAVSGEAMETAQMQESTVEEVLGAIVIIVPIILFLLIISTMSWIEPVLFIAAIGVSILINMGTNIILGQVSFITYSVSPILQLAVSLDYAIFLLHAFAAERENAPSVDEAMVRACKRSASTIAASATTTLFGFAALAFMKFEIGADLGLNLVKGIVFSFVSVIVFLPALTLLLYKLIDKTVHRRFMPTFKNVDKVLSRVRIPALLLVLVIAVPAFLGQAHTQFTYQNASPDPDLRPGHDTQMVTDEFGRQNPMVVLVPLGDVAAESALTDALAQLDHVSNVVSYANSVGATIPSEFLDDDITSQFYSQNWARIIVYLDTEFESDEAFASVAAVQNTASQYYDTYYTAGQSANLYDMKNIVDVDNVTVSLVAVFAILLVLLFTFRSIALPLILVLTIEAGIWINLATPYFAGDTVNFIGYLVINTVQLGATVDYGILLTHRYLFHRQSCLPRHAIARALGDAFPSLIISAGILATAGFALSATSSLIAVASLGALLGRGALISLALVTCFLPGLLVYLDGFIRRTTLHADFYQLTKSSNSDTRGQSCAVAPTKKPGAVKKETKR